MFLCVPYVLFIVVPPNSKSHEVMPNHPNSVRLMVSYIDQCTHQDVFTPTCVWGGHGRL